MNRYVRNTRDKQEIILESDNVSVYLEAIDVAQLYFRLPQLAESNRTQFESME
jgi:hypothetical protein